MKTINSKGNIKYFSDKKLQRLKEGGSEAKLFQEIREEREHKCDVCWKYISEPATYCFPHILSKKMYPKLRLCKENVGLVCSIECHNKFDKSWTLEKKREFWLELIDKYDLI